MAKLQTSVAPIALSDRVGRISVSSTMAVSMEAQRLRSEGASIVDFGAGEPDFPTPENVKEAAIRAIRDNFSKYTAAGGAVEVREAIAARHAADFGTNYAPNEVIVTAGGKQAIFNLISCLINAGDEVLLPVPYWVTFRDVIHYVGGQANLLATSEEKSFALTAEMVQHALTPRTRLVIVNSPSNPSGAVISEREFARILEVTASHGALLLTDECYCQFVYQDQPFSAAAFEGGKEHVVVVGSLSKTYAMTGWRLGFALAPATLVSAMVKLQSHSTSNPSSIAQKAAVEALGGPQDSVQKMLAEYRRRRNFAMEKLREIPGLRCNNPQGAFYAYPNVSGCFRDGAASATELAKKLIREAGVAVVPGEAFGTREHFRISYATSLEALDEGLRRMKSFFAEQNH